jgi:hypothetical protein
MNNMFRLITPSFSSPSHSLCSGSPPRPTARRFAPLPLRDSQVNSAKPQRHLPAPLFRPRRSMSAPLSPEATKVHPGTHETVQKLGAIRLLAETDAGALQDLAQEPLKSFPRFQTPPDHRRSRFNAGYRPYPCDYSDPVPDNDEPCADGLARCGSARWRRHLQHEGAADFADRSTYSEPYSGRLPKRARTDSCCERALRPHSG